jgi:hypothetical protein
MGDKGIVPVRWGLLVTLHCRRGKHIKTSHLPFESTLERTDAAPIQKQETLKAKTLSDDSMELRPRVAVRFQVHLIYSI